MNSNALSIADLLPQVWGLGLGFRFWGLGLFRFRLNPKP